MPEGTKVEKVYKALKRGGMEKGRAAAIAQAQTGTSLSTGKPPKSKSKKKRGRPESMSGYVKRRKREQNRTHSS